MNTEHLNLESSLPYPKRIPPRKKSRSKRGLKDYEFVIDQNSLLKTSDLGAGALGRVKKVREKATGELYAMKIMNKQNIFRYSSKENLKREVAIQKSQNHPHIIKLYHYFEDKENVYLILELAENGSLFDYIRTKGKFTENEAFVYFFQTALGVNYLHKNKIIHRDLKPENLLLDKNGNIKVCDFGWSAETQSRRATFCGTVDYMAPEMIKNQPYDHRIDIWSLGILLYELIHGYPPFEGKTDQEKSVNISKNKPINFNISLSWEVCDLIRGLLRPLPEDRLTMNEIFRHNWMRKYEKIYQIDLMSYVEEQDLDSKDRDSSNDSKRDSLREDEDDHRKSGHSSGRNSLEEHDKVRNYYLESLEGRNRGPKSHGNLSSTKDSERNSGDLHQYYSINLDGHSKFRSIPPSLTSLGDEERGRTRPKYLSDIDTSMRIPDGLDRGSLAGTENLSALFRKNFELERKLKAATKPKPSLFKRILMEFGCISRDPRTNFE